ncbi:hypothetical protein [Aequoribacter sp.]|uniref:hypothetical protein n=1 Tax=Aequoribacter sp. TaxID=2847771 RepID=UPI003F69B5E0
MNIKRAAGQALFILCLLGILIALVLSSLNKVYEAFISRIMLGVTLGAIALLAWFKSRDQGYSKARFIAVAYGLLAVLCLALMTRWMFIGAPPQNYQGGGNTAFAFASILGMVAIHFNFLAMHLEHALGQTLTLQESILARNMALKLQDDIAKKNRTLITLSLAETTQSKLKRPIQSIRNLTYLFTYDQNGLARTDQNETTLEILVDLAREANSTLKKVRALIKSSPNQTESVEFNTFLNDCVDLVSMAPQHTSSAIEFKGLERPIVQKVDTNRWRQLVWNVFECIGAGQSPSGVKRAEARLESTATGLKLTVATNVAYDCSFEAVDTTWILSKEGSVAINYPLLTAFVVCKDLGCILKYGASAENTLSISISIPRAALIT